MTQTPAKMRKNAPQKQPPEEGGRLGREVLGLCAIFCGLIVILSLATFDGRDPWINHSISSSAAKIHNKAGSFGAYLSGSLFDLFGMGAWIAPVVFCVAGARRILGAAKWVWWRWAGFFLLALCICMLGAASDTGIVNIFPRNTPLHNTGDISSHGGGLLGRILFSSIAGFMGSVGAFLIWLCVLLLAMQMLTGISWLQIGKLTLALLVSSGQELVLRLSALHKTLKEAREARAGRKAQEAFDLVAIEGLPPEPDTPEQQRAIPVLGGTAYGLPEDIDTPREAFLEKIDRLDREAQNRRGGSENGFSFSEDPPLTGDAAEYPDLYYDDLGGNFAPVDDNEYLTPQDRPSLADARYSESDANIPPWVEAMDQPQEDNAPGIAAMPRMPGNPANNEEDFIHALWREAGHEVTPLEHLNTLSSPLGGEVQETAFSATSSLPAPAEDAGEKSSGAHESASPRSQFQPKPFAPEMPAHAAPPATVPRITAQQAAAIPIHIAKDIQTVPAAPRDSFVGSVIKRMKRTARVPLPSLELLQAAVKNPQTTPRSVLETKGVSLMNCLRDFNVQGELVGITPGPVVTMFEVRPAPGVRVSRIANLSDDLALALKAVAVRIQAPVPGTDTVGIEIPNDARDTVCLKELLSSKLFHRSKSLLTLALGKDIAGNPAVADLSTMPHLLVAGATGAGKSVGINSIILSMLYKARPHEVKLLLVDPKRVEMAIYADLPHLVHPVVTEMQMAKNALEWAVVEMEQRYDAIARAGVRNISDYNAKVASFGDTPPAGMEDLNFMPYLVIVIDELADLMLVAAKEVETSIVRLAQLARAAGIHLILATQRPSVDVVTGLIKANFPCRISFQVTSKHDSRTILDSVGAEHLLGKGDMLFKPAGGKFQRMHGAFVSDKDVHAVVNYWKSQLKPEYSIDFADWHSEVTSSAAGGTVIGSINGDIAADPMYAEAVDFVRQQGKASISLIQRKFRIGFNKAARYVEQMEQDGIIGAADGSKPRVVIG